MKITFLELIGFKRFKLARLNKVAYTPTSRQQLILGTNGSGKSSILSMLSPLPARPIDFKVGGRKVIHIEHGLSSYVLTSDFSSGNKHSFIKDNEELNEGRTYQVQLRLVRDHFRYTEKLHDVLIGAMLFTDMRPQERREMIMMMSETDWSYGLTLFNQLKTRARDASGAFKYQQSRLAQETENLAKLTNCDHIKERAIELRNELNALLIEITPNIPEFEKLRSDMDQSFNRITQHAEQLLSKAPSVIFNGDYHSFDAVTEAVRKKQSELEVLNFTLERATKDHSEMEGILGTVDTTDVSTLSIEGTLTDIQNRLQTLHQRRPSFDIANAAAILPDNDAVISELTNVMQSLPDNSDGRFSRQRVTERTEYLNTQRQLIDDCAGKINRANDKLSHLKGTHDTTCPRCEYIWKVGVNLDEVAFLEQALVTLSEKLSKARLAVSDTSAYLEEAEAYNTVWQRFRAIYTSYPRLKQLFDHLLEHDLLVRRPNEQLHILTQWTQSVRWCADVEELTHRQQQLQQAQKVQEQFGGAAVVHEKLSALETEIQVITPKISKATADLHTLKATEVTVRQWIEQYNVLDSNLSTLTQTMRLAVNALRNKMLDEQVQRRHLELSDIQKHLSDRQTLQGIISDLKVETEKLELRYKSYQLMTNMLSPTEGLIADRLRDSIYSIVEQMNTVIASVWSYDLKIQECGFEGGDLDYKFPVAVETPDDISPDISKTSKGQREIINIAFKLTAMLYLNMLDYPLFLDEPGEGFDEQHRGQIMSLIRQMLDSGHYSQLFMVSHIASSHGAFLDAESLVLDASNITLPSQFNQHVILE